MFFEVFVVGLREIASEMNASAFPALMGGLGHKQADGEHILAFPAARRIKDLVHYVPLPEFDNFLSFFEGLFISCDSDISPHKGTK